MRYVLYFFLILIQSLASYSADIFELCQKGRLEELKTLDITEILNSRDRYGTPPIHYAVFGNQEEVIDWLIAKGADLKAEDRAGLTVIHTAAFGGHQSLLESLVARGLEFTPSKNKMTAVHCAARGGCLSLLQWLVDQGLELRATDSQGQTAVHHVAK